MRGRILLRARERGQELGWLAVGAAIGIPAPVLLAMAAASVPASLAAGLGLALLGAVVWTSRRLADAQRHRAAVVLDRTVPSPYMPLPASVFARLRAVITDPATWRDLAWLPCQFLVGLAGLVLSVALWLGAAECVTAPLLLALVPGRTGFDPAVLEITARSGPWTWALVPVGVALAVAAYHLPRHLVRGQARLAAALLGPTSTARLSARVNRLTATRAAAVDASATELRRIERDLHDGAQVRLVAMAMNLGVAEDIIDADPAGAKALLAEAKAGVGAALTSCATWCAASTLRCLPIAVWPQR